MHQQTPWKMASRQHHRGPRALQHTRVIPFRHKSNICARRTDSFEPGLIGLANVDWTLESAGPFRPGRVIVRMGDDNGMQAAEVLDFGYCFLVKERDEVPEDVSLGCLDEDCAFSDGELYRKRGGKSVDFTFWHSISGQIVLGNHTLGSVFTHQILTFSSSCHQTFLYPFSFNFPSVVKTCPVAGTYCLGSSQILHSSSPDSSVTGYCVPHSLQMRRSSEVFSSIFAD